MEDLRLRRATKNGKFTIQTTMIIKSKEIVEDIGRALNVLNQLQVLMNMKWTKHFTGQIKICPH